VTGVDIAPALVGSVQRLHPGVRTEVADVRRLPFEPGTFDAVVSNSTLDHLATRADIAVAVRELHRVMRAGGHLLITLDNPLNPIVGIRNMLPEGLRESILPYALGATLGPRRLRSLLVESGFEVLRSGAVFHSPRVLVVLAGHLFDGRRATTRQRYARMWSPFEWLGTLPTRYLTGHFVAVLARKR
jgi:SAM-dependent methyltransferase